MNIIFDQGNTRTKVALFEKGHLMKSFVINDHQDALEVIQDFNIQRALVSSVVDDTLYEDILQQADFPVYKNGIHLKLPFSWKYETPQTLGNDRIALAAAAATIYSGKHCLVIDAGSCITYDMINDSAEYLGGAISPGKGMRFKAMNSFTARLPKVDDSHYTGMIGNSTASCMASGVLHGIKEEVRGTIQRYEERFPQLLTIITGGDAPLFDDLLKNSIFASPDFLLQGLNNILDYHAEML